MSPFSQLGLRVVCTLLSGSLILTGAYAGPPKTSSGPSPVAGILQFTAQEGSTYSALILPVPDTPQVARVPHDHVLIMDTSASQTGLYRTRAQALADGVCRNLPAGDRVQLIAADVTATRLTEQFVAPASPELRSAFATLEERVPLGSTNIEVALRTAMQTFSGDRARQILYIGDGFSTAKLVESPAMLKLLGELRASSTPVNCFAIGPRTDLILLGTLGQHTGGLVIVDEPQLAANGQSSGDELNVVAKTLAQAAAAPVFYPESLVTSPDDLYLYPVLLPPVRFDRETVLLGKDLGTDQVQVTLTGKLRGQPQSYSWLLQHETANASTSFLAPAWTMAENSQGLAMPFAGRQLLNRAQQSFEAQLDTLAQAGARSLVRKDQRQVEQIAKILQELDPENADAPHLLQASHRLRAKPLKRTLALAQAGAAVEQENNANPADEAPAPKPAAEEQPAPIDQLNDTEDKSNPKSDSLLDDLEAQRKVREEQITIDVNLAIQSAQAGARDSFPDAYDILKRQLDTVVAATDISADVRQALRKRVEAAMQQMQNESEKFEQNRAALDRQLSQQEAMKKLMDQTQRDEEKMEQLIDRVRALMIRGFKGNPQAFEDAEAVSRVAVELDPYLAAPNLDVFDAEAAGHLDKARRLRSERQDKLLALLYQVELSHVPFPDEPPIVWPSPERWQWITENRRKWKSVDLKSYSKKEEKIVRELDKPTTFDFTDESLDGVRDTIMERHGFDIVIDKVKLEEESVATDATDITLKVSEISLKNALKLLLDSKNLTYVIENEVMKITTKTDGIAKRPLRVYNVGDLVMPINPLFGMGGSSSGGQTGNGGQFNGGQQGGQFGGGANGLGGGGGGIGLGVF